MDAQEVTHALSHDLDDHRPVDQGILIVDFSLNIIAADCGAASILADTNRPLQDQGRVTWLSITTLDALRASEPGQRAPFRVAFRIGNHLYSCSTYVVEPKNGLINGTLLALHLTRETQIQDILRQIGTEYRLTNRERQALAGISLGLTSKQMADQMNISPNTVKAFTRLIMLKMGVASRTAILSRLLEKLGRNTGNWPA